MIRVDPAIFRDISTNNALVPSEDSLADEVARLRLKVVRLKCCPWVESVILEPNTPDWQRIQNGLLYSEHNPVDTLLEGALDFLDVNDLASVNLVIAESSQIHLDLVSKQHIFENQANTSKISRKVEVSQIGGTGLTEQVESILYQTVSATNIQETNNNLYLQMSNALTGNTKRSESTKDIHVQKSVTFSKNSLFNLPLHLV
jgi:hypothetical protein